MPPSKPAAAAAVSDAVEIKWDDDAAESGNTISDISELLSKRLLLDIVMKLPVIVVPLSSTSTSAIVMDLGGFSIANELRVVPGVFNNDHFPAVIDWTVFNLSNVNIAR